MSDVTPEATPPGEDQGIALPADAGAAFSLIMDTLAPEEDATPAPAGAEPPAAPAPGDGSPAPAGEGAPAEGAPAPAPAAGDAGGAPVEGAPAPGAEAPPAEPVGFDAAELNEKWGEVSTGIESRHREEFEKEAISEIRTEHSKYFEALQKHPRELAGQEVPSLKGEGMETLRDGQDAREWQEAVTAILKREIADRASQKAEDVRPMMETLHNSVSLFQNNPDLVPGSKQFDKELANDFAALAKPYELRVNGKLVGYSMPVQGLVTQLRQQLTTKRGTLAATPAAPAAPSAQQQRAAEQPRTPAGQFAGEAPQAGIPSKAGNSGEEQEDFGTLFSAFGLPDTFRI